MRPRPPRHTVGSWRARQSLPLVYPQPTRSGVEDKGLKKNAIGFASSVVIGVASTAPGYSLAATLGFVAAAVGTKSPAILLISFVPMFLVAGGYYYMNKADPDCGTSFSWVTKAMGPQLGWMAGWAIVVADVLVMANLAQIAGLYTFELFGWHAAAESTVAVTLVGVDLDHLDDLDRAAGDRALRPHPDRPARGGDLHPRPLLDRRLGQGLLGQRPDRLDPSLPLLDQPVLAQRQRNLRRDAAGGLHLLGLGHDRDGERGDRGSRRGTGQGDRDRDRDPARRSTSSSPSPRRPTTGSATSSTTRKTCSRASAPRSSARRSTSC